MYEQWHPLGVVGVISAFNFPVAVWSWNALLAAVCGDCVVWKPSLKTPLTAIAVQNICDRVLERATAGRASSSCSSSARTLAGDSGCWTIAAFPVSAPPDPRAWAASSAETVAAGWAAPARTGRQQRRHRDGRRQSRPGAARGAVRRGRHRRASAAPASGGCSCARDRGCEELERGWCMPTGRSRSAIRCETGHADGSADRRATPCGAMTRALRRGCAAGRRDPVRRRGSLRAAVSSSRPWSGRSRHGRSCSEEIFAPILYVIEFDYARRGDRLAQRRRRRACRRPCSPPT